MEALNLEITARQLAQIAMDQAGNDVLKATEILEQQAAGDIEVWKTLTEGLLRTACYDACRRICISERQAIWFSPGYDAGGKGDRIKEHSKSIMDWPLPGGKALRHANKQDLIDAAEFYKKQADQMASIAQWLNAIAAKVKNRTVEKCLTEAQIRALRGF